MAQRLRRVAHPLRLVGFVVLVLALVAGAFVLGRSVRDPDDEALQAAQQQIEVYSTAERRVVDAGQAWQGEVREGEQANLGLATQPSERAVVTRAVLQPGAELEPGDLVAVVSGRPRILIPAGIPLFRDLRRGDRGDDVAALQRFLAELDHYDGRDHGRFDWATETALRDLFDEYDFGLPTETTTVTTTPSPSPTTDGEPAPPPPQPTTSEEERTIVRWEEFVQFAQGRGTVVAVTPTATVLTDDLTLCRLQVSPPSVAFVLPVDAEGALSPGQEVAVAGSGGEFLTTIRSVGDFRAASEEQPIAGFPVIVDLPADAQLRPGYPVRVSVPGGEGEEQLAVPTVAVKQGAQGPYVSVKTEAGRVDVGVQVLEQEGGWTAIEPADPNLLAEGSEVLVS